MEKEMREFLESMKNELQDFRKETNNRFDDVQKRLNGLEEGQTSLEEGQTRLEQGQKEIKDLIEELDPKNANRHVELVQSINELRNDLTNVEIITSSNWNELAKLKKIK